MRIIYAALFAVVTAAPAAAKSLDACGGFAVNARGLRDGRAVSQSLEDRIADFGRESGLVPGFAVAIVKDGKTVYLRGFGVRDLESCAPVDAETRFYLKSTTKSFLGMLAAVMHEDGAVQLDAPITDYLPDLKLPAPLNAAQIPLRAHFTHTIPYIDAGLNYATAAFGNIPEEDYVAHVKQYAEPRPIKFIYSNFSPIIGAAALGAAAKSNWADLIETKIFAPAGMTSSFTHVAKAETGPLAASYLTTARGEFEKTYTKAESQMVAAGGAYSTAADMARWLMLNLEGGVIDGAQALPRRAVEQAQARQVQLDWDYYEFHRFATGLGFHHADYEGDVLSHHFGGETHFSFMPERGLGVVILTNAIGDGDLITHRLAALIYDELLHKKTAKDRWASRLDQAEASYAKRRTSYEQEMTELRAKATNEPKTFSVSALAGRYDGRLGPVTVSADADVLAIHIGAKDGAPEWLGGDAYLVDAGLWGEPPAVWTFCRDSKTGDMLIDWGGRIWTRAQ